MTNDEKLIHFAKLAEKRTEESRVTYAMKLQQIQALILLAAVSFCFSTHARAEDASTPSFQVQQIDPNFDVQKMAAPGVQVHTQKELANKGWKLPSVEVRNHFFYEAGIQPFVAKWDELDKDRLFVIARDATSKRLIARYSKLPKDKLLALSKFSKETAQAK